MRYQILLANTAYIGIDRIKRFISEFRDISSHQLVSERVINSMTDEYLKNGIIVIVAQGMSRKDIGVLEKIASAHKASFFVYRLEADEETLAARVQERTLKLNKPAISQEDLDKKAKIFKENDYPSTRVLDLGKVDIRKNADIILRDLGALV